MLRKIIKGLGFLYLLYLAVAMVVVLPLLNVYTPRLVLENTQRELRSELLWFNPFTLALHAKGISLHEDDGHNPLAFRELIADLSIGSLWDVGVVLDEFSLDGLKIHVLRYGDGHFHFDDLVAETDGEATAESSGEAPGFTVDLLRINAETIRFTDETKPGTYTTVQRDLNLETRNLTTVPERQGDGDLVLVSDGGGVLTWRGELDIGAGRSFGMLSLENGDLTNAYRYNADELPFVLHSGRLDITLNYEADWDQDFQLTLSDSSVRIHRVAASPPDLNALPHTSTELAELSLDGLQLDLVEQAVGMDSLSIRGLSISGYDEDGEASLQTLFAPGGENTAGERSVEDSTVDDSTVEDGTAKGSFAKDGTGSTTEPAASATSAPADSDGDRTGEAPGDSSDGWRVALGAFSLDDSQVNWRSEYLEPEIMRVTPIAIAAQDLHWPAERSSPISVSLTVNEAARLTIEGDLHVGNGSGNSGIELSGFPLSWLHPLVHQQARTDLATGVMSLDSTIDLAEFAPITVQANLAINDFSTVLHNTQEQAFALRTLRVNDVRVDVVNQDVAIDELYLDQPEGSLHVLEDGTININGVVREFEEPPTGNNAKTAEINDETESGDWRVRLASVILREGRLEFSDASLPLPFHTQIAGIKADITDIDTASESPMAVELNGSIDGYAPVEILGSGTPLAKDGNSELSFRFRGMDIATMSPYSGTFVGYTIDSGTLNLDLRYALNGQRIDGDNRIVISQMMLGEPMESDLAVDVPLKLGLALLTDSEGVIDLSVPVSGNVDDPSFSLGPIIATAVKNIIVKAVTAPFSLLAGLVGSEEDLEHIAFYIGSDAMTSEAESALTALADALAQRPQLTLTIEGNVDPAADGRALRLASLEAELMEEGLSEASLDDRDDDFAKAIANRFESLQIPRQESPDSAQDVEPTLEEQLEAVLAARTLAPGALQDLGSDRAAAAKRSLVTEGGVDAARISIRYATSETTAGATMSVDT
ncbi:MAG: DUF748 domain-containing protein [Pseudomonadota bacterium]